VVLSGTSEEIGGQLAEIEAAYLTAESTDGEPAQADQPGQAVQPDQTDQS
jgi:hypothetical protein